MIRIIKILLVFIFIVIANHSFAQNRIRRTNKFLSYKEHINEIGYSLNLSYIKYEGSFAPHLYLHYAHRMNTFFSLGIGYGSIYDNHFHNILNLETILKIDDQLNFSLKPGVAFKNTNGDLFWSYCMGFEVIYEIEITDIIHIGPTAEINFQQDDTNYLIGFHMGFTY